MRWRWRRSRPEKPCRGLDLKSTSESGRSSPSPRDPRRSGARLTDQRNGLDANGRDLVPALAQDFEPVAVEGEDLARLRDRLSFVNDEARYRRRLVVGQVPV